MPVPSDPYDFVSGTIADPDQVDERFSRLYNALNPAVQGVDDANLNMDPTSGIKSFLRLLAAQRVVMTPLMTMVGATGVVSPGASITAAVTHNLGTTNVLVIASPFGAASNNPASFAISPISDGQTVNVVNIVVANVSGGSANASVRGVVIGFF